MEHFAGPVGGLPAGWTGYGHVVDDRGCGERGSPYDPADRGLMRLLPREDHLADDQLDGGHRRDGDQRADHTEQGDAE